MRRCGLGKCGVILSAYSNSIRSISSITCSVVTVCGATSHRRVISTIVGGCNSEPSIAESSILLYVSSIRSLRGGNGLFARSDFGGLTAAFGRHSNGIVGTLYLRITRAYGLGYSCYFTDRNGCRNSETMVDFRANGHTLSFLVRGSNSQHGLRISFFNKRPLVG